MKTFIKLILHNLGYEIRNMKNISKILSQKNLQLNLSFDMVLKSYLYDFSDNTNFKFLQIGSYDGVMCDPLYPFLVKHKNWQGIMMEPQSLPFNNLKKLYKDYLNIKVLNKAIASDTGKKKLFTLEGENLPNWTKGMASFIKENILDHEQQIPNISQYIVSKDIETICFNDLLEDINEMDLLLIDTEGYDGEIIKMFPFHKLKPKLIRFESKHIGIIDLDLVLNILQKNGYLISRDGEEDIIAILDKLKN